MTQAAEDNFPTNNGGESSPSHMKDSDALPTDAAKNPSGQSERVNLNRDYSRTHVMVCVPHNGNLSAGVLTSIMGASRKGVLPNISSPLRSYHVWNFNASWCSALNANPRPEFFIMHHADVMAEQGWLDKLIELIDETGADIVSSNICIKDQSRELSTAVFHGTETEGRVIRMGVDEAMALPKTFSMNDVETQFPEKYKGGILLLNTGLWICRFRDAPRINVDYPDGTSANIPWTENFSFKMIDAIVKTPEGFAPQGMSEDWQAALDWHVMGLDYRATSAIKVHHFGNAQAWTFGGDQ